MNLTQSHEHSWMVHVMIRQIVNFGVGGQQLSALIDIDPHDERVWLGGSVKRGACQQSSRYL